MENVRLVWAIIFLSIPLLGGQVSSILLSGSADQFSRIPVLLEIKILIIFWFLLEDTCCGISLDSPWCEVLNEVHEHMFSWGNKL